MLEARVAAVEKRLDGVQTKLDKVDDRLRGVEIGMATLTERVAHLPSKGFIVQAMFGGLAFITAIVAFQDQIKAFFH